MNTKYLVIKPEWYRSHGRTTYRWEENIQMDIRVDWNEIS